MLVKYFWLAAVVAAVGVAASPAAAKPKSTTTTRARASTTTTRARTSTVVQSLPTGLPTIDIGDLTFFDILPAKTGSIETHAHLVARGTPSYSVVSGDTGNSIVAKYSIPFNTLSSANQGVNWNNLAVGQSLAMPSLRKPIIYSVAGGDTGNGIASKNGILFIDLSNANPSVNWNNLQVGQKVQVPGYGTKTTYTVASGDTGTTIATGFCIAFSTLSNANSGVNWNNLQVGQVLQIPVGASPSQTQSTTNTTTTAPPSGWTPVPGEPSVTQTATVTGANAVQTINNQDGQGSRPDQYTFYQGDGTTNWPAISSWESFENMWNNNGAIIGTCSQFGVTSNSADETKKIYYAIQAVAAKSKLDHRFLLAVVLQESSGCVRVPTTVSPPPYNISNPGLMQSHMGVGTCNSNGNIQNPCQVNAIFQMIEDGAMGTSNGDGLVQTINQAGGSGALSFYKAARLYNSGSIPSVQNDGSRILFMPLHQSLVPLTVSCGSEAVGQSFGVT